jgi:hypothetical protein
MKEWFQIAFSARVVRRACVYGVIVGAVLVAINYGAAILHGQVTPLDLLEMGLTVLVPYCVSTLSSVGAIRELPRDSSRES